MHLGLAWAATLIALTPRWLRAPIVLVGSGAAALLIYFWVLHHLHRLAGRFGPFVESFLARSQGPSCAILVLLALGAALPVAALPGPVTAAFGHVLLACFVLAVGWSAVNTVALAADLYLRRFRTDVEDNLLARKHVTQVHILRRIAQILIGVLTVGAALMTSAEVRQYGVSLFASAGAAGLILGLAARPVLSNLLAGIQIAVAQPIRVEDAVVVEGEWGWIETIGSTYVVIRIWDLRRLIVPLTYFIEKPFQNWTHEGADLIGSVYLNVDYTVPVARVRAKLEEIAAASPLWDRKVVVLQVTDTPGNMVQLRALVSARNSSVSWDLRCEVREKLIAWLQENYPNALPRQRWEVLGTNPAGTAGSAAQPQDSERKTATLWRHG